MNISSISLFARLSLFSLLFLMLSCDRPSENNTAEWKIKEGPLLTSWAEKVNPDEIWKEYPRPQHQRREWQSLNGLWNYAITEENQSPTEINDGEILVPFPVESALSGVMKSVSPTQILWYSRKFEIPENWKNRRIILHFGAVEWLMTCLVNGKEAGSHKGGFDPFSFDITPFLKEGENELKVAVMDPTNTGDQPVGKQTLEPEGIFYTAVTGIWQTVWMEPVNETYLKSFELTPNIDNGTITIVPDVQGDKQNAKLQIEVFDGDNMIVAKTEELLDSLIFEIQDQKLWHPDDPFLYDMKISLLIEDKPVDEIQSYFGMRKIHIDVADDGFTRMFLNNEPYFHNGPLDQGYWPDGLYCPPSDQAMEEEVQIIKDMGFNMLRKHVKIEPHRFYYWCDKKGILVWQDMPNGDEKIGPNDPDIVRTEASAKQFEFELTQMIKTHFNHPSIIMWVPFNEGWGQYNTAEITDMVKKMDPSRLVNNTSGWSDRGVGDVHDIHNYPEPAMPDPEKDRAVVLGEFGGISLSLPEHLWDEESHWGYAEINDEEAFTAQYENYYTKVWELEQKGLSAAVYTQITDVESETNGLLTYDRKISKIPVEILKKINTGNYLPAPTFSHQAGLWQRGDAVSILSESGATIYYTTDGSPADENSSVFSEPIKLNENMTITTFAVKDNDKSRMVTASYTVSDLEKPTYKHAYSPKYPGGGIYGLMNGQKGGQNFLDGNWQGFHGQDMEVTLEIDNLKQIDSIIVNFYEGTAHWIFLPDQVEFQVAGADKMFQSIHSTQLEQPTGHTDERMVTLSVPVSIVSQPRFVKVIAKNAGVCPDWHPGKGGKTWIFVDEIEVK